jgi:hypothetical protein
MGGRAADTRRSDFDHGEASLKLMAKDMPPVFSSLRNRMQLLSEIFCFGRTKMPFAKYFKLLPQQ